MIKSTESESHYQSLETKSAQELFDIVNKEDQTVAKSVEQAKEQIVAVINVVSEAINNGLKVFYIGAGTSGRLGILDASECPPTYGVSPELFQGLIAGGDSAIRTAVEGAEDDKSQAIKDLKEAGFQSGDVVIGIAASGSTPYVIGGVIESKMLGGVTACITCNSQSELAKNVDYAIEVVVGPEVVTGSTRMKSGTAQKLVLNMISTISLIKAGRVKGNKMVDMQLSNAKLVNRGTGMIMAETGLSEKEAKALLLKYGSVREAVNSLMK